LPEKEEQSSFAYFPFAICHCPFILEIASSLASGDLLAMTIVIEWNLENGK